MGFARVLRCLGIIDLILNHGACWVFGSRRGRRVGVRVGGFRGQGFRVWGAGLLELWAYGSGSGLKILDSYMLRHCAQMLRNSATRLHRDLRSVALNSQVAALEYKYHDLLGETYNSTCHRFPKCHLSSTKEAHKNLNSHKTYTP